MSYPQYKAALEEMMLGLGLPLPTGSVKPADAFQIGRKVATRITELEAAKSQWQPIETAPKETEVFIGRFIDDKFKFGRSELFYEQSNVFAGETFSGWVWSEDECSSTITEDPTHWMPTPKPPAMQKEGV